MASGWWVSPGAPFQVLPPVGGCPQVLQVLLPGALMKECSSEDHRNSDRNDLLVALGRARPTTDAAIDLLKKFTKDEGLFIRRGAVTGLGEVDPSFKDKIIPTLEAIANDPGSDEQLLASDILELLGGG